MKKLLFVSLLAFSGCTNIGAPTQLQLQQIYGQSCASYIAVMKLATAANKAGKLNDVQRKAITEADAQAAPICTGPTPTDINAAVTQVTAAVATISINAALNAEKP